MIYFILLFFFNLILFKNYLLIAKFYNLFDYPDKFRKKHLVPTPLLGGVLVYLNLIFFTLFSFFGEFSYSYFFLDEELIVFILISSLFFFLGYCDDKYQLSANVKLISTSILILVTVYFDNSILIKSTTFTFIDYNLNFNSLDYIFTVLCFLLFINSFNMIDGINGQSISYCLYIFLIFIFFNINLLLITSLSITLCIFLIYNFKSKMFMGDSGTMLLAFIISYLFIKSHNLYGKFYADEIFLIMMIPGIELLRLAVVRLFNNKHPFSPDRNHIHHIMLNKFNFIKTFIIIQILFVLPFVLYLLISNSIIALLVSLTLYFYLLLILKNEKKKI